MMSTMSHSTPLYLFSKTENKKAVVEPEDGFGYRMSSFSQFSGNKVNPARQDIQKKVKNFLSSITGTVTGTTTAAALSRHLCMDITRQLGEIISLISDWYEELTQQCDYKGPVAWNFIGFCIRCILDYLVPPRMEISALYNLHLPASKATIIWTSLEVHRRMNEMIDSGFKSHHVVTTAMSNFIMKTRVDKSTVDAASDKAAEATKAATACEKKMSAMETELKSLKQSYGNKLSQLEKKK
jgi:hypothetical protein